MNDNLKYLLLEDLEESQTNEYNYVIIIPEEQLDLTKQIVDNSIREYHSVDQDEYYIGYLRKILLRRGIQFEIKTVREFFSGTYSY